MKYTFPILTLSTGGAQRMLVEIANGLVDKGHDVTILMPLEGRINYPIKPNLIRTKNTILTENDYPKSDIIISNYYLTVPSAFEASKEGKGMLVRMSLCYEPTFLKNNHLSFPTYYLTTNLIVLSSNQQHKILLDHGIEGHIVPVGISTEFENMHIRDKHPSLQISAIVRKAEGGFSWQR